MCCSCPFVWSGIFNSPTHLWKQGLSDVLLFWILSLGKRFTVLPMKQEVSDVLLFVILVFGLKSIFQQSYPFLPMKAGIEWCAALLWFPLRLVLRVFSTVLPNFYLWKQVEWCAALVDFFLCVGLKSIFNSPTQFLPEAGGWVMCCSFVISFLCLVLKLFSTVLPNSYLWKQGLSDVLFCDSFLYVWS
jgi:hypothetical protein